tara:strand:+ start:1210 stop:1392 length:183 start_codon:yes stop_codon:yes gene_type:complete
MNTTKLADIRKKIDLSGDSNLLKLNLLSDIELNKFLTVFNEYARLLDNDTFDHVAFNKMQ